MFISLSRHKNELRLLELSTEQKESLYQNQIRILESQISDLRKLVFAPVFKEPTPEALEVDRVITPVNDSPIVSMTQESDEVLRERDRLFSGEFEQVIE